MNDAIRMQLSAFVDGELPENEAELLLRRMSQDVELRQEVAEYLALGRLMRAETGIAGADRLHERIAAAIDDRPIDANVSDDPERSSRAIRPLAGAAIAATVTLVAIFALQQTTSVDDLVTEVPVALANGVVPSIDAQQERQRQFLLNHAETSSELGANGMISKVVTLRFNSELSEQRGDEEAPKPENTTEDVTQP